jgi:hypothetical protein
MIRILCVEIRTSRVFVSNIRVWFAMTWWLRCLRFWMSIWGNWFQNCSYLMCDMSMNWACFILCHELTDFYNMFKTTSNEKKKKKKKKNSVLIMWERNKKQNWWVSWCVNITHQNLWVCSLTKTFWLKWWGCWE